MIKYHLYTLLLTAFLSCATGNQMCTDVSGQSRSVVHLDDGCWEQLLEGEWMVGFCTPVVKKCNQFEAVWTEFATEMQENASQIEVASMQIEYSGTLIARFSVNRLPSILHVRNGTFRQLPTAYTVNELMQLALEKWKTAEPMSFWRHPNGWITEVKVHYLQAVNDVYNTKSFGGDYNRASLIVGGCCFLLLACTVTGACSLYATIRDILAENKIAKATPKKPSQPSTGVLQALKPSHELNSDSETSSCSKLAKID